MSADSWRHVFRKPRHPAEPAVRYRARIERTADAAPAAIGAEVINVSRSGFQLRLPVSLAIDEDVVLRLGEDGSDFNATLPGTVRWQRREESGTWLLGCSSASPVPWETLGELFLHNVLAADKPCA